MPLDDRGRSRDDDAFDELFVREWPRVVRIAQQITHSLPRSEEVAQDVFLAFHRRFPDELPERPGAWLHRSCARAALNDVRSERRRRSREEREARLGTVPAPDPGEVAAAREEVRAVREALGRLKAGQAELLALRYGGLSYNEIAQATGVPVGQIGTRLHRAEMSLRREMQHAARN